MTQFSGTSLYSRFLNEVRRWSFPLVVLGLYGLGILLYPEGTECSLQLSVTMLRKLFLPMCFAFVIMVVFNRFLSPATVVTFLGKQAGLKGICFSTVAGVLSMGPVYAWYPLLKTLRAQGASTFNVANFICCRSIKPFLLPVMVSYWGWNFSLLFVVLSLTGALLVACVVAFCSNHQVVEPNTRP